jgi:hypothetical protein
MLISVVFYHEKVNLKVSDEFTGKQVKKILEKPEKSNFLYESLKKVLIQSLDFYGGLFLSL